MDILHIISGPGKKDAFSTRLSNEIVKRLEQKYPSAKIKTRNLVEPPFSGLGKKHIKSFTSERQEITNSETEVTRRSDEAIAELSEADIIVAGGPMYNFSIHSSLKIWIDHVLREGKTFRYTAAGHEGLLGDRKVYLALASGSIYNQGPMQSFNFTESYMRTALGFMGITDITVYRVEGVSTPALKERTLAEAISKIKV